MKVMLSRGSCNIIFEDNDIYPGKRIRFEGEMVSGGFQFLRQTISWATAGDDGINRLGSVDEKTKEELISYFVSEGQKEGCDFDEW
jgi:hypothetical protein